MRASQTYLLPYKVQGLGLIWVCLVQRSPFGLENFLTCTEASDSSEEEDEVTYLARDLCFLLSEYFFGLALANDPDFSEFGSEGISDSNLWTNCDGKAGPTNSVSMGSSVFCAPISSTWAILLYRLLTRTRLQI